MAPPDFEITPAMRAYLEAFDAWLLAPRDDLKRRRWRNAAGELLGAAPRAKLCQSGKHVMSRRHSRRHAAHRGIASAPHWMTFAPTTRGARRRCP